MNQKKIIKVAVLFALGLMSLQVFAEFEWDYDRYYLAKRFYLHPLVNYDFAVHWYDLAEKNQYQNSQFRLNIGSVSLNNLDTEIHYRLNRKLNQYVWFRVHYLKLQKHELLSHQHDVLMSFDFVLTEAVSLFIAANADYDKSLVDTHVGVMLSQPKSKFENYMRISFERPQFVYDYKNKLDGKTTRMPYQINWTARYGTNGRWLYSEGAWQRAFIREYPENENHSLRYHKFYENRAQLKVYQRLHEKWLLQAGVQFRDFFNKEKHHHTFYQYRRRNFTAELRAEYTSSPWIFRPEIRFHQQRSEARYAKHYDFTRDEFLYAAFIGRQIQSNRFEIGVVATHFWTELDDEAFEEIYRREQKALLGWSYYFTENTILRLSVSHVFTIHGFGGGNMQFITNF